MKLWTQNKLPVSISSNFELAKVTFSLYSPNKRKDILKKIVIIYNFLDNLYCVINSVIIYTLRYFNEAYIRVWK